MKAKLTDEAGDYGVLLRTARKPHRCRTSGGKGSEECTGWNGRALPSGHTPEIKPGDVHVEDVSAVYTHQSGPRYCLACAIASGLATEVK